MKLIEVLSKLEEYEIPNKTKFKWRDSVVINKKGILYCNDMFFSKILNFGNAEALKEELEIIEEDKPIEKILVNYQDGHSQEEINEYLRCEINELIDEVNKLKKESDK